MTESDSRPGGWMTGRSRPPLWVRLFGCLFPLVIAVEMIARRGVVVGLVAAVVYGLLGLSGLLRWEDTRAWSKRHPLLDSLIVVPLLFLGVAYCTRLPVVWCVFIAVAAGLPLAALAFVRRRARRGNGC